MKRRCMIVWVVLFVALLSVGAFAAEVVIPIPFTKAALSKADKGLTRVELPGFTTAFSGGDPALPCKDMRVLLPSDADLSTLRVFIRKGLEENVHGRYDVQACAPVTTGHDNVTWGDDARNIETYGVNAFYPSSYATLSPENRVGEYLLVPLRFWPYRYNPVTKQLRHIVRGTIVVSFSPINRVASLSNGVTAAPLTGGAGGAQRLADLNVINSQDTALWYGVPGPVAGVPVAPVPNKLVILTTADIQSHSAKLAAFVADKTRKGFRTTVYTESAWSGVGLSGDAAADAIRMWLRTLYDSKYKWYLLIIGDPSPTSPVPMKDMYPCGLPSAGAAANPTDFYYADISGNWDLNANGYPGETSDFGAGGIDIVPEFITARIPYYGSIADLDSILTKIIAWDSATSTGAWAQRVLYASFPSAGDTTPGWQPGEQIRADAAAPNSRPFTGIYEEAYGIAPTPRVVPCNVDTVANEWAKGYGFVFWFTHGCDSVASNIWCPYHDDPIGTAAPSFVFSASCDNARPTNSWNVDYLLLLRHSISACGATELSWYRVSGTTGIGDCANQGWVYTYALNLAGKGQRCGDAFWNVKTGLAVGDCWANYVVYNMYGDPTLAPRRPTAFAIDTPATVPPVPRGITCKVQFEATGGLIPYTWNRTAGTLPTGLSLSAAGLLSGTPTTAGTYTFTLQAAARSGQTQSRQFTLTIITAPTIATGSLPAGKVGSAYTTTLTATGGTAPYTLWHTEPEGVVPGLSMDHNNTGVLSGTPTTAGTYNFAVRVMDANKIETTKSFSVVISN